MDATEKPANDERKVPFVFPKWVNAVPIASQVVLGSVGAVAIFSLYFWGAPTHWYVGYTPKQPVPYSHKLHAGDLGIDCRYCHIAVEKSPIAMVPPAEICMNCHTVVFKDSPRLALVRESFEKGTPIEWVRVHKVADFAYFDHSRHLNKGVGCVTCHGRIDQEEVADGQDVRDRHQGHRPADALHPGRQDRPVRRCRRGQDGAHHRDDPPRRPEPRWCVGVRRRRRADS